jgi:hypothetical protein
MGVIVLVIVIVIMVMPMVTRAVAMPVTTCGVGAVLGFKGLL